VVHVHLLSDLTAINALDKVLKPKTKRAKRFLEKRELKFSKNIKNAMLTKGGNANATMTQVLKDMYTLKKPYGVL
jgi:ribosome production factor 2